MTAEEAENIASAADGTGNGGTSERATLVLVPAGGTFSKDTLTWKIDYQNVEMCPSTPIGASEPCNKQTWTNLIDATTGEEIEGYTTGSSSS